MFNSASLSSKPLFVLEMANNHMGDVKHGLKIIREFHQVTKKFNFNFAFKFQYRDLKTFIHPAYKNRMDLKYVKRFSETRLSPEKFLLLKREAQRLGFLTICTPFDEKSVDLVVKHNYAVIKVGSCSFTDWPLLEKIAKTNKPVILSTGGASLEDIDKVVSFFQHRQKTFALMHCVGEYPTKEGSLQLNQITLLKNRYQNVTIGFSTHEEPDNFLPVQLALAKGAQIFERHVGLKDEKHEMNAYSSTPEQIENWLKAAQRAIRVGGAVGKKALHSQKELADIRQFQRGVFAKESIKKGELISLKKIYLAFPNQPGQLVANDLSKYKTYHAKKAIKKNGAVIGIKAIDMRADVYTIVKALDRFINKSGLALPERGDLEISHHYGIAKFNKYGVCMITSQNKGYCKKHLLMFPGQIHPTQYHRFKEETFRFLYGRFELTLDGVKKTYRPGEVVIIKSGVKHAFTAPKGGIIEEISRQGSPLDSYYLDPKIITNKNRKTLVAFWRNVV